MTAHRFSSASLGSSTTLGITGALFALVLASGCVRREDDIEVSPGYGGSTTPVLSGDAETIASDPNVSAALAITPTTLFWVDRGASIDDSIQALPTSGGAPVPLFTASSVSTAAIEDLAVDANNVYVTELEASADFSSFTSWVVAVPQDGSSPVVLATAADTFFDLTVAGAYVYYTNGVALFRVPTTGGATETVYGKGTDGIVDPVIGALSANGSAVYWTVSDSNAPVGQGTQLMTLAKAGAKRTELTAFAGPTTPLLATDSDNLFWIAKDDNSVSYVVDAPPDDASPVVVGNTSDLVVGLIADESNVYYLTQSNQDSSESIVEAPITGGGAITLVSGIQAAAQGGVRHALAQDDSYVYFVQSGAVMSVPK
jgi:hypothetical protein